MRPEEVALHSETLTQRQRDVLLLLASGSTMKQAARILGIKERTIAFHKYQIKERFHLRTNTDLIRFAIKQGIVGLDSE
jgi:DNA-binding CsgD family transcriptional regulator